MSKHSKKDPISPTTTLSSWRALSLFSDEKAALYWTMSEEDRALALKEATPMLRRRITLKAPGSRDLRAQWLDGLRSAPLGVAFALTDEERDWAVDNATIEEMAGALDFCTRRNHGEPAFLWLIGLRGGRAANPIVDTGTVTEVFQKARVRYQEISRRNGVEPTPDGAHSRYGSMQRIRVDPLLPEAQIVDPPDRIEFDFRKTTLKPDPKNARFLSDAELEDLAGGPCFKRRGDKKDGSGGVEE